VAKTPAGDPVYARARFASIAEAMASVPVVSAALGAVAGLPAARFVSSHFALMVRDTAQVLIAGPAVLERALGEHKTKQQLGGAQIHGRSGVVDNVCESEEQVFAEIRRFLGYLPTNVWELPPRLVGHPVGVMANDSRYYAGATSAEGAQKVRRFVDEPGFMIGAAAEAVAGPRQVGKTTLVQQVADASAPPLRAGLQVLNTAHRRRRNHARRVHSTSRRALGELSMGC